MDGGRPQDFMEVDISVYLFSRKPTYIHKRPTVPDYMKVLKWLWKKYSSNTLYWGIQVILVMSVILWHEKTKIQKIIGCGNFDVFSVKTIIHNNIKKMGHLIWSLGVQLHAISWKWDVTRWHKAGWMIVVTCQTLFFCHKGTISAQ